MKPSIDSTEFGTIVISGELYEHDVVIRLSGKVKKRQKKLSKARYGTSHKVSLEEAETIFEAGAERLIIGTGQSGMLDLSKEATEFFRQNGCSVQLLPTPEAVTAWNSAECAVIGMFHITC
ncbi:MAG: Mth938-like domain-containing protein [Syntrophales bacterium]